MVEYMKVTEAALYLGITSQAVYKQIKRDVIKTKSIDGVLHTTVEWLNDYEEKKDTTHHATHKNRLLNNPTRGEYSVAYCAELLGVSRFVILSKIKNGRIAAMKRGGYYVLLEEELERLKRMLKGPDQLELLG